MSVLIKQNDSDGNNADLYVSGRFVMDEEQIKEAVLKSAYPVGSVYISVNNVNPSTFIGGTWTQISQGRVLVGVGNW